MKKNILFLIVSVNVFPAQTTITKLFNDPAIGDVINNYTLSGTVDNSAVGNNVIFDNSGLMKAAASATAYTAPSSSEIGAFPGSTIKMNNSGNVILYKATATKLEITGFVTAALQLNFSADNGTVITYPAAFGHSETDNASGTFSSSGGSGLFKGTITTTADASGTLLIGPKTYTNVLRLKSVQNFNLYQSTDTNYLFPVGTMTNISYLYYDSLHKFPLLNSAQSNFSIPILNINQNNISAEALDEAFLSVTEATDDTHFYIAPNPTNDYVLLHTGNAKSFTSYKIFSIEGKLIHKGIIEGDKIPVYYLSPETYILECYGNNIKTKRMKLIKK